MQTAVTCTGELPVQVGWLGLGGVAAMWLLSDEWSELSQWLSLP